MNKRQGFTLAEVLITLAIIGVVAAMTIPSVIINTNQQEFKTGLKKAVSVLNQAITMNIALESENPGDVDGLDGRADLITYFTRRLNVIKTTKLIFGANNNQAFYTTDGMRFEMAPAAAVAGTTFVKEKCKATTPCLVIADVNGDKKPNPDSTATNTTKYKVPGPDETRILDVFTIMITDTAAIPYGKVAQRTMFQNE